MHKNILYVTDLDGTLLHHDERISKNSCEIINALIEQGMKFSFATARSIHTATVVTQGLELELPIIVNNGTFITDIHTRERIVSNQFTRTEAAKIYEILCKHQISPLVYAVIDGAEKFSYDKANVNSALSDFIDSRKDDGRDNPLNDTSVILQGDVFYFTCIGEEDKLYRAHEELKAIYNCIYQKDIYSNEQWLEIMPHIATKAHAIQQLKQLYQCDTIVTFGDGVNDIPMFQIADRCYAVSNAVKELKEIATDIIGSNEEDGVAVWLQKYE